MPFPEIERVIYSTSPLVEVVCELQFPPILKISADEPYDFQERVRRAYPKFAATTPVDPLPQDAPDFLRPLLQATFQDTSLSAGARKYHFSDPNDEWEIVLSREAISLTTTAYTRWERFLASLVDIVNHLFDLYEPSYFSRIGLRYKDLLSPQKGWKRRLALARPNI